MRTRGGGGAGAAGGSALASASHVQGNNSNDFGVSALVPGEGKGCRQGEEVEHEKVRPSGVGSDDTREAAGTTAPPPSSLSSSSRKNAGEANPTEAFLPGEIDPAHRQQRHPHLQQPHPSSQLPDMSAGGVPSPVSDISVANANPAGSPSVSSQNNAVPSASTGNGESCTSVPGGVGVRLSQTPAGSAAEMPFSSKPSPAALPRPPQPPPPPHASSSPSGPSVAAPTQGHHPPATAGASSPAPAPSDKGRKLSSTSSQRRPTLFNLLDALAHDSVTTPDQRNCIRSVVTDFLNHSLPHARVYTFIGAIVGHDVLHAMVRKLEEEPAKLGAPDQGGLARIEKAFGLTKSTGGSFMNEKTEKTEKSGKPEDRHPVAGVGAAPSSSQGGVPAGGE